MGGSNPANDGTVADAVTDWLTYGLNGTRATIEKYEFLGRTHIISALGKRKLRDLTAQDVDRWLTVKAKILSGSTVQILYSCLNRSVARAMARDKVKRNVVALCTVPRGQKGRPSRSLTLDQAKALLSAAENTRLHAYVVLSLLTGARTEELRALTWAHVDLAGRPDHNPPLPPCVQVWRSVRAGGDTKTKTSRRTLALPLRCVHALTHHRELQERDKARAGSRWQDFGLVFASSIGTPLFAGNIRRSFRRILTAAGLNSADWTPRELRHSFVSLLSSSGIPLEDIADLCGHAGQSHGSRLPAPAPTGAAQRCGRHGQDLRTCRSRAVVTQIVTQAREEAMFIDGTWPLTCGRYWD